jgi:2,3-bisphosphoglycerate-independent phosphoglycerate mutase
LLFDRLRRWNKYDGNQNMKKNVEKSTSEFSELRKQMELIGIEVKGLDEKAETGRLELKTKFINQHFINELDKIGLQLINIRGTWFGRLVLLLEQRNLNSNPA